MVKRNAIFVGSHPHDSAVIGIKTDYRVLADRIRILPIVDENFYLTRFFIENANSAVVGTYPDIAVPLLLHIPYEVGGYQHILLIFKIAFIPTKISPLRS